MRIVALVLALACAAPVGAMPAVAGADRTPAASATDLSSQSTTPRTRIVVRPAGRLVRECDVNLVREVRASGTYVVPRERCWWARR